MGTRMNFFRDDSQSIRTMLQMEEITASEKKAKILVVDDDPMFCRMMQRIASMKGISVVTISSFAEAQGLDAREFDVAILDYMLDQQGTGLDVASNLSGDMYTTPVILVSHTSNIPGTRQWPASVREFIHKNFGPYVILDAAIEAFDIANLQRDISKKMM